MEWKERKIDIKGEREFSHSTCLREQMLIVKILYIIIFFRSERIKGKKNYSRLLSNCLSSDLGEEILLMCNGGRNGIDKSGSENMGKCGLFASHLWSDTKSY